MLQRRHDQKNNLFTVTKLQCAVITTVITTMITTVITTMITTMITTSSDKHERV